MKITFGKAWEKQEEARVAQMERDKDLALTFAQFWIKICDDRYCYMDNGLCDMDLKQYDRFKEVLEAFLQRERIRDKLTIRTQ